MRLHLLPRALATISLLLSAHSSALVSSASCAQQVTAQPGDTCASIAAAKGITVAQFIRSNPPIASCSSLVSGSQYCVDPSFIATTTTTTSSGGASSTTAPLEITKDGKCGDGLTCAGSAFGQCCSEHGWCGQTTDHCGVGCQAGFGVCGGGVAGSSSSSSVAFTPPVSSTSVIGGGTATATTTTTIKTTATQTVKQTSLLTSTVILTVAATTTQTLQTTKTQTVLATTPVVVLATSYVVLTSTAVVTPETTTAVVTRVTVVTQNSIIITRSTITTIRTITITNAAECSPTGRETFYPPRATARAEARPVLVQPGVVPECRSFYQVKDDDSCDSIVEKHSETLEPEKFYAMNRQITGDCQGLWLGYWVCVGI
ncbi:hypothetical protein B0T22DRAFT_512468 [Podospora appendiculata]|uniref:Carbohydrate-binding module family 18 protein n=1 Tax=Podospora appendiculata TaxID=314037 RepID=A0AAE0X9Z5_9PEZI|nr:hypothetical protein B0T22DRAFT_512468 [Podospora appendiculata]